MEQSGGDIDQVYAKRSELFARKRDECSDRSRQLSQLRLLAFLAAVAPFLWPGWPGATIGLVRPALALFFLLLFLTLVVRHQQMKRLCVWYDELSKLNDEGRSRLARDWDALPPQGPVAADPEHPFADDLDLFGDASLFSLLGGAGTPDGRERLRAWLLEPAAPDQVRERQAAVAELAPMLDWREELTVRGRLMSDASPAGLASFSRWAGGELWLLERPWLIWTARLLPIAALTLIGLNVAGLVAYTAWAAVLILNLAISRTAGRDVHRIFDRAFARESAYREYAAILHLIESADFRSPLLTRFQAELRSDGTTAHERIARLRRLLALAEIRFSMAYLPLQAAMLWDFHVLERLERWQQACGHHVARWLAASSEVEALAALAGLKHDNPDWVLPQIADGAPPRLQATDLGHPLLAAEARVANHVEVGPPHSFLMITGSNMSGKSTLLRAIGTNVVLGLAGGPVCASSMRLPPLRVATSMRVHDSLRQGLSHFMAELQRLKWVVDLARAATASGSQTLIYLLDDILQGTNSAERQVAARSIIGALSTEHVIGAVTTHDLTLADTRELRAAARPVHFSETIEEGPRGPRISFDYKLRPGIATSSNALKLLKLVGLEGGREGPSRPQDTA